ncbi:MAG: hypothetical protein LBP42_07645 [Treponema sp.]|jgi:DNA-binding NarL/FixJ family response regulator|nr:hypothetical protein [Treponema sp.]
MTLSLFFSLAGFIICLFFCLFAGFYLRRRTGQKRILEEFREEVNKLIAVIDDATDRDARLVEERVKSLKALLADVDKRVGAYTQEIDRRHVQEKAYAELGKARLAAAVEEKAEGKKKAPPQKLEAEEGVKAEKPPPPITPLVQAPRETESKPLSLEEQVKKLARAGFSANVIAARLGVSISEVELVLAISQL